MSDEQNQPVAAFTREVTQHQVNDCNKQIRIVSSEPDPITNAPAHYELSYSGQGRSISFQNGPVADGVNGITHEALLAIICDRIRGFQAGKYACRENALALTKLEEAVQWLKWRTDQRVQRGVEGTHKV